MSAHVIPWTDTMETDLEIEVNERIYNCILDTGSDVIFPYTMGQGYQLWPTTTVLKAVNGSPIPLLVEMTVKAVWNDQTIPLQRVLRPHTWMKSSSASHASGGSLGLQDRAVNNSGRDPLVT